MYGDAAKKENDWAFHYLPKVDRNYSWTQIWDDMYDGKVKGMFAFGMNGVMIGPDSQKNIDALKKADWLVVGEIYPDETSEFWRVAGHHHRRNEEDQDHGLPAARARASPKKTARMTNSARWLQWKIRRAAAAGRARARPGHPRADLPKVRELYKKEGGKFPDPILNLTWSYTDPLIRPLSEVAKEINGKALADLTDPKTQTDHQGRPAAARLRLAEGRRHDRSAATGSIPASWTEAGPQMQRRGTEDPSGLGIYPNWAWSWPANRRVLYNRASCDPDGKPWDPDAQAGLVERSGGRSGSATTCPTSRPTRIPKITWARSS